MAYNKPIRVIASVAGSGDGNPGGSQGQVQYNNSGVFAGSSILVINDTTNISSGEIIPLATNTHSLGSESNVWSDVHATTFYGSVVLESENGTQYRLIVGNDGTLSTESI